MSSIRFSYQSSPTQPLEAFPNRQMVFRPVIDARVLWHGFSARYKVLIDSGADFCIFHAEIGELLGVPIKEGKKLTFFGTSGYPQDAYFHNIQIEVGGHVLDLFCGFSYDMKTLPYGLLGQTGFFDKFKIEFDYTNKRIELKPK